jgi:hypothetical protein
VSEQQKKYAEMSDSEKKKEDWMNSKWRPMMGWMYMVVCMADFVLFPILWSTIQAVGGGQVHTQWQPITLQGAGLFHIAMGAVLGIAAFGRTQEKLGGANNGGIQPSMMPTSQSVTTTFGSPSPYTPPARSVPSYAPPAAPMMTSSGKFGPAPVAEPEL